MKMQEMSDEFNGCEGDVMNRSEQAARSLSTSGQTMAASDSLQGKPA